MATNKFKKFYNHWLKSTAASNFSNSFPYELSLEMIDEPPAPFCVCGTPEPKILVTESYENMFCRLLHLREDYYGCSTGAVLTGQPGTGESR